MFLKQYAVYTKTTIQLMLKLTVMAPQIDSSQQCTCNSHVQAIKN